MSDNPAGAAGEPGKLKAGSLHWLQVATLGIAIAISGNVSGWNYGLGVGGWGGMLLAALAMAVLFLCLTQSLAELAAALPAAGGFDGYVRRALGPTAAYLAGMSVAIALAVGAGLAVSFSEAYVSAWLGFGGWPIKLVFLTIVMGLQLRGASEAVGLTVAVGATALVILIAFCLFMAPEFQFARLFSVTAAGTRSLLPHGLGGAARCIPYALFLFLGVEQSAHAAAEMRDMARNMPKALATAIGVAFVIGICVLLIATGGTGADRLAAVDDPLFASVTANPGRAGAGFMVRLVGAGALVALLGTFFSIAYASSRQFYHLAQAEVLPRVFGVVNSRQAPSAAVYLVAVIALATAAFPPSNAMVVFIFMISVSHVLIIAAFLRLRHREPELARTYRAIGGSPIAVVALFLSLAVMVSCYQLEARALQVAIAAIAVLIAQFVWFRPVRLRAS
ncbi:MAG TPA: amino acid permease [Steroidobacteraceae bacterium]|nr:amino acid permease [Steroidobacteraceae bacterium]